jgi:hypothetical protein
LLSELSSFWMGGIWQYSFTTFASASASPLSSSHFLRAALHVVCGDGERGKVQM